MSNELTRKNRTEVFLGILFQARTTVCLETTALGMISLGVGSELRNWLQDELSSYDFPFGFYFPQDSIRCLELSNDIVVEQLAAEKSDIQDTGTLAQFFCIEVRRDGLHEFLERNRADFFKG